MAWVVFCFFLCVVGVVAFVGLASLPVCGSPLFFVCGVVVAICWLWRLVVDLTFVRFEGVISSFLELLVLFVVSRVFVGILGRLAAH